MYEITVDNEIIHDVRLKNRTVLSPVLELEVGKNGTLSFILPPNNELYNSIEQKKSIIKVYQVDKTNSGYVSTELFRGTAYSEKTDFWKRKHIDCEGELSFFNDSIVRPYDYQGGVTALFQKYVNDHNSQVNETKRFTPRRCTVTDSNDYITRANINYPSTRDEMNEKLLEILGGHFETLEANGTRYIDYLAAYENTSSQIIEFGKNLLDITQFITSEEVATRIIPLGKKDEETGEYLTIKSVNNNLDYVQDNSAVALFGVIEKIVVFEDVTQASNLLTKGQAYLNEVINKTVSIDVNTADLHNLDVNIEAFKIGEYVRVISRPHNLDRYFLVSKLHLELDKLSSSTMTLGATFKSFTQKQIEAEKQLNTTLKNASDGVIEVKQNIQSLNTDMQEVQTAIQDIPSDYVSTQAFNAYKTEVNQKLFGIYTIKGNVNTYNDLLALSNKTVGDVYNVLDTGANYVWTDTNVWDKLSETIDLSNYVDIATFEALEQRVEALENS